MTMKTLQELIHWNANKWEVKNKLMYTDGKTDNQWPWFNEELDPDVFDYFNSNNIASAKILDLGTCSGSQALELAKLGHTLVGTDISETALNKARDLAKKLPAGTKIEFVLDDVLVTKLAKNQFDYILDRGCFHSVCYFGAKEYIENVYRLLKPDGKIILKTMSAKETRFVNYDEFHGKQMLMPCRFDKALVEKIFSTFFNIEKIEDSFFYSAHVNPPAQAVLTVLSKKPLSEIKL